MSVDMKIFLEPLRKNTTSVVHLIIFSLAIFPYVEILGLVQEKQNVLRGTPMHKVQLTQKGYIQFLRWELPVPEITEFTFCLWMQSDNLTHPHSIFSYSKNERERLARTWISPYGKSIHIKIAEKHVASATINIQENRWYHICVSWESRFGRYGLWINGQLWASGHSEETIGHIIPSGGDIVLGQEYTDFDEGLEDGIEGSVLGFNLLLASAFNSLPSYSVKEPLTDGSRSVILFARIPTKLTQHDVAPDSREKIRRRMRHSLLSIRKRIRCCSYNDNLLTMKNHTGSSVSIEQSNLGEDPLGLQLIKLSYVHCEIGRGSPYIGGALMLISWSRSPVRIFGGATLKNVRSDCGNF